MPTKGLPCATSFLPGASPINKTLQGIGPSPVIKPPVSSQLYFLTMFSILSLKKLFISIIKTSF
ncbi:hypothetical protein Z959_12625 [Clostridium novyi B str. ATCC 27606]|uniref:Uncharacterized protein n=2 Tax=Clostridium TaxID=1485 RepID=A0AA40ITG5_CLONO|nr:hypothetical protein Z958_00485 [Clostridium novyi B str. NCTC 9691]KEI15585.1 hypothetical protein Z959_12625 [Clostridium novyi B str. ATCC 27606]KEI15591.1 hypothetical protein Z960_00070 [Clostridium haemolyticum NCTC 9693]